jgi:selenocysteine-specific elongation factor
MQVIATAGHVDHGKSTLVRALTGMEPDRWAEERRRGLTIDLGFAWTGDLAFVDVPGHERFVPNMLAGIGSVPAALLVVAADEGWMPQTAEHVAALDALDVRHGLLAVTKADRADPAPVRADVLSRLAGTSLAGIPSLPVSAQTGGGVPELLDALTRLASRLPAPDTAADVRLWVDRSFTIRGAGTVVTGTLAGGTIRVGDELALPDGRSVQVRGLQSLGTDRDVVTATARVAVNLRGMDRAEIRRGEALLTPGAWRRTAEIDVRLRSPGKVHQNLVLHLGSAAVPVRVRLLDDVHARIALTTPLPLRVGDRGLLRDPGEHRIVAGFDVLEVWPPPLTRRGAAAARARELNRPLDHLDGRGFVRAADATAMGWPDHGKHVGQWLVHPDHWRDLGDRAKETVSAWLAAHPLAAEMPAEDLRRRLELPSLELVPALVDRLGRAPEALPAAVERGLRTVEERLAEAPFRAPEADQLHALGLGKRELAAAIRAGRLTQIADGVVLGPGVHDAAAKVLAELPSPFTVSEARRALDTTRRVAVPLLEELDRSGRTRQLPDTRREVIGLPGREPGTSPSPGR